MRTFSRWIPVLAGAIAGGVIALVIASANSGTTTTVTTTTPAASSASSASATSEPASIKSSGGMTINQIYKAASPGVVDIIVTTQSQNPGFGFFGGGGGGNSTAQAEGAGVVYDNQGDILTDEHVVANATSVKVTFWNNKQYPAKVLGTDKSTDVGVIRVNAPASELHPLQRANSDSAQVGDPVVAIGSPFSLPETVTAGIVSQTGRAIQAPNGYTIPGAIQTDAAINPGNSGGPLLNAAAQVLGLNDQIETNNTNGQGEGSSSGIGFATPINTDAKVADQIISGKTVQHAYVGVSLQGSSQGGAKVAQVSPNSPATAAGLEPGDLITAIDGHTVTSTDNFISMIDTYSPGQTVTLSVKRSGVTKEIKVKLGVRPATAPSNG